jgi:predicted metal-binding protein
MVPLVHVGLFNALTYATTAKFDPNHDGLKWVLTGMLSKPHQSSEDKPPADNSKVIAKNIQTLVDLAARLGASDTAVVAADQIVVEPQLADYCVSPGCAQYGLSRSCPPHVEGPEAFQAWLKEYNIAMAVKIEVPSQVLMSDERREVFELLHHLVAGVERAAIAQGYQRARAFAGGSCKQIFCDQHATCRVVDRRGRCRNPRYARPSMSGFGVNVGRLMQQAGWRMEKITRDTDKAKVPLGTLVGLILID